MSFIQTVFRAVKEGEKNPFNFSIPRPRHPQGKPRFFNWFNNPYKT